MIELRDTVLQDFESWLPLWQGYLNFLDCKLPDSVTRLTWERFHDPQEKLRCLAAFSNGEMVGFAAYLFHRSTWAVHYYCYLEDLYVSEEWRGQGIGTKLIKSLREIALQHNCTRYYWVTLTENETAQRLYDDLADRTDVIQYRMPLGEVATRLRARERSLVAYINMSKS